MGITLYTQKIFDYFENGTYYHHLLIYYKIYKVYTPMPSLRVIQPLDINSANTPSDYSYVFNI